MNDIDELMETLTANAEMVNSVPAYDTLGHTDSQNVTTVQIGQTLSRLARIAIPAFERIVSVKGEAAYEPDSYPQEHVMNPTLLVWVKFRFDQVGDKVKLVNLSEKTECLLNSMTQARQYIRTFY
jgi:hypothetical protein